MEAVAYSSAATASGRSVRLPRLCAVLTLVCWCLLLSMTDSSSAYDPYITYGEWNAWGFCTDNCRQYRRRSCKSKNFLWPCNRNVFQQQSCFTGNCVMEADLRTLDCGRRRVLQPVVQRIFGGIESQPHSWPWHVSLVRSRYRQQQFCGGTLIHPQFVLTARHCVISSNRFTRQVFAIVGDHDTRAKQPHERVLRVVKIRTHPSIQVGILEFDVALLKLEEPVTLGEHIQLACLPPPDHQVASTPVNTMCTAIGFGRQGRSVSDGPMSPTLHEAYLYITDSRQCESEYRKTNVRINPDSHVCAAAAGRDTCSGDSGGGLFCSHNPASAPEGGLERWYLYGITSFGHPRGCGYHSGVFQRVSVLFDWVQNSINADLRDRLD